MLLMEILGFFWFVIRCLLLQLLSRLVVISLLLRVFIWRRLIHQSKFSWFRRFLNFVGLFTVGSVGVDSLINV